VRLTTQCTLRRAVLALRALAGHCLADSGHLSVRSTRAVLRLESAYTTECLEHSVAFCLLGMLSWNTHPLRYVFISIFSWVLDAGGSGKQGWAK
jgi:hypothetical protein